ncbi:hypothetical protein Nepgr_004978 [Nepenthes gracilis]|uniref:Uncharacterized protein n=1 Tax=Nepenthes gracilis TaxID=150966 RepID=A0AAD3S2D3_NEPGR|nr:hypothetical protein Nepgr_004978 [Nepenthes gracilis]
MHESHDKASERVCSATPISHNTLTFSLFSSSPYRLSALNYLNCTIFFSRTCGHLDLPAKATPDPDQFEP